MSHDVAGAKRLAASALAATANPTKAGGMQTYMKSEMPFYGVQKPGRTVILRDLVRTYQPTYRDEYEELVLGLWSLPHREEKYLALGVARHFEEHVTPASLPLYRRLIVEGAWWDFVDEIATKLIRRVVVEYPDQSWPVVDTWIDDEDMWLRRTAILSQIGAKERIDAERLFRYSASRASEREFFIRKAIGWALREHAKTDPEAVAEFVTEHRDQLSGLSFREATRHIGHLVG